MRKTLLLLLLTLLLSCKKNAVDEELANSYSFRISILPVKEVGLNKYNITGTVDIRTAADDIEYGLVLGKSLNPTVENDVKYKIGTSKVSADFNQDIQDLDTGFVYYLRAYGLRNKKVEYSANQVIGKLSPKITFADSVVSYGHEFMVVINTTQITSASSVKVSVNNIPATVNRIGNGVDITILYVQIPDILSPGRYELSASLSNYNLVYAKKIHLIEGRWTKLNNLSADNSIGLGRIEGFVRNDWIYTYNVVGTTFTNGDFSKYNYTTGEKIKLAQYNEALSLQGTSIVQQGSLIHFIGGQHLDWYENPAVVKPHYVYSIESDSWHREADFPGKQRKDAVSLLYDNKIFYGLGYKFASDLNSAGSLYTDLWSYDLTSKTWKKAADFPRASGQFMNAFFAIGSKIYITGGGTLSGAGSKETWCYDASVDKWKRKADYPGRGEIVFTSFSLGNFGYVGMGESVAYESYYGKNFDTRLYKYDPLADTWLEVTTNDELISNPVTGTGVGGVAVIFGGTNANSSRNYSLYTFKP